MKSFWVKFVNGWLTNLSKNLIIGVVDERDSEANAHKARCGHALNILILIISWSCQMQYCMPDLSEL